MKLVYVVRYGYSDFNETHWDYVSDSRLFPACFERFDNIQGALDSKHYIRSSRKGWFIEVWEKTRMFSLLWPKVRGWKLVAREEG